MQRAPASLRHKHLSLKGPKSTRRRCICFAADFATPFHPRQNRAMLLHAVLGVGLLIQSMFQVACESSNPKSDGQLPEEPDTQGSRPVAVTSFGAKGRFSQCLPFASLPEWMCQKKSKLLNLPLKRSCQNVIKSRNPGSDLQEMVQKCPNCPSG